MKPVKYLMVLLCFGIFFYACEEGNELSERVKNLTSAEWQSDSLLLSGLPDTTGFVDASETFLMGFKGSSKFNTDGTGQVGIYPGTWSLNEDETILTITSDSLPATLNVNILELTSLTLKVGGSFIIKIEEVPVFTNFRMVFKH